MYTVPEVPRETATSPGSSPSASAAAMLSPVPAATIISDPNARVMPAGACGPSTPREPLGPVDGIVDDREELEHVWSAARGEVSGARRVTAVGHELARQLPGEPVVRQAYARDPRPRIGLGAVQPRELGDGERGDGHRAARRSPRGRASSRPPPRAASGATPSGADSVSFHNLAGRRDVIVGVEHDEPVLLAGDGHPRDVAGPAPVWATASCSSVPPCLRVLLAARRCGGRMRRPARPDQRAGVGVARLHFGRLRRRVDAEHERHA